MGFRLPRPLHGWREFTYEIAITVIGVLLALARGLQQCPILLGTPAGARTPDVSGARNDYMRVMMNMVTQ